MVARVGDVLDDGGQRRLGQFVDPTSCAGRVERVADERVVAAGRVCNADDDRPALGVGEACGCLCQPLEDACRVNVDRALGDTSFEYGDDTLREDKMGVCTHRSRPLGMIPGGTRNVR